MALNMARPYKHPKTGIYWLRKVVPEPLRAAVGQRELKASLGTRDPEAAKVAARDAQDRFDAVIAGARAKALGQEAALSVRELTAALGAAYRAEEAKWADDPGSPEQWDQQADYYGDLFQPDEEGSSFRSFMPDHFIIEDVKGILKAQGILADRVTIGTAAEIWARERFRLAQAMLRRCEGDWTSPTGGERFPEPIVAPSPAGATLDALLAGWGLDRGWTLDMKPIPRALYDRLRTVERLADFLGHRDAKRITKAEAVRWKAEMMGRKLTAATVRNDMSEVSALWKWGQANGLDIGENPFSGTLPPKAVKPAKDVRAFTDAEAVAILRAAREAKGYLRWVPWVLCCTGARLNEIAQASRSDVFEVDGVAVIRIHDEGEGLSVKNTDSRRTIPLHPALLAEGFMSYVAGLPAGSPLWPDMKPDNTFGRRSGTGGKRLARWLRETVGITDPRISPSHSWRHTFIERCRRVVMPLEVRSALTGHSAKLDESAGYGAGVGTMVEVMAGYLGKVVMPPVAPLV